jgi:glutamyl-Q tRNA(Asp) synthetase
VVDDAWQGVTHVVRGADLLSSTARQIFLQRALGVPALRYLHVPVVTNPAGEKLSKQTGAEALRAENAAPLLREALAFLGVHLVAGSVAEIWREAASRWRR